MGDIELRRSGPPGPPDGPNTDGPNTAVRWGLLLSVALHAGVVALLVGRAEPPVYHAPESPFDVTFIDGGTPSASQPAPSAAPASPAASPTPPPTPPQAEAATADVPAPPSAAPAEDPPAETKPPPAAEAPPPRPVADNAEPAPQPVAAVPPPVPAHRPPPSKPAPSNPAPSEPAQARPAPARTPLTGTSVAAEAARSWRPPSGSAARTPPDQLQSAYAGLIKARISRNMIHPREPGPARRLPPVVVRFHILADGSVRNLAIVRSSGDDILDRAAEETIRRAAPFPPIPATVDSRWIDMTVTMNY